MPLRENEIFCAERVGCGNDAHFEIVSSADGQEPRQRHAAGPARGAEFGFGAFFWNPTPENAVTAGVQLSFLRVVCAMVKDAALLHAKDELFGIELTDFPNHATCR